MAIVISSLIEEIDCFIEAEISGDFLISVFVVSGESVGGTKGEGYRGYSSTVRGSWRALEGGAMGGNGAESAVRRKRGWEGGGNIE